MLQIPTNGFARSVKDDNGRLDLQADWIEATAALSSDTVSQSDVVDALIENNSYEKQDNANLWVNTVFRELERRFHLLGEAGTLIREGSRIRRIRDWEDRPAYSFCLTLGMLPQYRSHVIKACGSSYVEQGLLFEELIAESLRAHDWNVVAVGWSKNAANSINAKIAALANAIGEPDNQGAVARWTDAHIKDGGLDLVAWRSYPDGWGGRPVCLVQCASGEDWSKKLHTPEIALWMKLIDFTTKPRTGLAMPFAPDADTFRRSSNKELLMLLLDRHRILAPAKVGAAVIPSPELAEKLVAWIKPRIAAFPTDQS
jgi:hypothetical protein